MSASAPTNLNDEERKHAALGADIPDRCRHRRYFRLWSAGRLGDVVRQSLVRGVFDLVPRVSRCRPQAAGKSKSPQ